MIEFQIVYKISIIPVKYKMVACLDRYALLHI